MKKKLPRSHIATGCCLVILLLPGLFYSHKAFAVPSEIDSLKKALAHTGNDTSRLFLLNALVEKITADTVWPLYNDEMGRLSLSLLQTGNPVIVPTANRYLAAYYNNLGYLQQDIGNNVLALAHYFSSLHLYESVRDQYGIANTLSNIGTVYQDQDDHATALQHYQRSFEIMQQIRDTFGMALALNNMGSEYNTLNNLPEAISCFERSLEMRRKIGDREGLGITLTNLGGVYDKIGDDERAMNYYRQSMDVQKESGDVIGLGYSEINFGSVFLRQKNFPAAEASFLKAYDTARKYGHASLMLGAANWLSKLYAAWGKYRPAYDMQVLYKQMTDSIRNDETRRQTLKKQIQYDYEKKETLLKAEQEKKDVLAKEEISRQKIIRNATAGAALTLIVSSIFVFVFYKRRKEAEMEHKLTDSRMRAINSQMNPHFIFNCMHSIQALVARQDFMGADNCLVRFAKLIRRVLDHSTQKEITLAEDLETLNDYVALEKMRLEYPLEFRVNMDEALQPENILVPPLLIQPVIENAILHGIKPKKEEGHIRVNIRKQENLLTIEVHDDGVGRQAGKENSVTASGRKSYGIPLTRERLEYLGKSKKMKSSYKITDIYTNSGTDQSGTRVVLTLPLHHAFD